MSSSGYSIVSTSSWLDAGLETPALDGPALAPVDPPLGPNCVLSAIISVRYFLLPSLSSQDLVCILPSTNIEFPFFMYCATVSACLPKTTTLWKSEASCLAPLLSFQTRLVAREKLQTLIPEGKDFNSGSRVRLPMMNALFRYITIMRLSPFLLSSCRLPRHS